MSYLNESGLPPHRMQPGKVAWRGARLVAPERLAVDFVGTAPDMPAADPRASRPTYEGVAEATDATVTVTEAMQRPALPHGPFEAAWSR